MEKLIIIRYLVQELMMLFYCLKKVISEFLANSFLESTWIKFFFAERALRLICALKSFCFLIWKKE